MVLNPALSQNKPMAGDIISGNVLAGDNPIEKAMVLELDSANRIVSLNYTDNKGRFVFFLVNAEDKISVDATVDNRRLQVSAPIDTTYFVFEMEKYLHKDENKRNGYPLGYSVIGKDSPKMEWIKSLVPPNYICGYLMVNPYGTLLYSTFLIKKGDIYNLIYKTKDTTNDRNVDFELANAMKTTVCDLLLFDEIPRSIDISEQLAGLDQVFVTYEGFTVYVVSPNKVASVWNDTSVEVPDSIWQEEINKFKKN